MRLRQRLVQRQRLLRRRPRLRQRLLGRQVAAAPQIQVYVRQAGVGRGEARVGRDRLPEQPGRVLQPFPGAALRPVVQVSAARIEVVSLEALRRARGQSHLDLRGERRPERRRDLARDVALDGEDVRGGQLGVVRLGPQVAIGAGVDQLDGHPHAIARPLNAALDHGSHPELGGDLRDTQLRVPVLRHRSTRDDRQAVDLRQLRQQVVVDAADERPAFLVGLHAGERQHGDGAEIHGGRGADCARGTGPEEHPADGHHAPERGRRQSTKDGVPPGEEPPGAGSRTAGGLRGVGGRPGAQALLDQCRDRNDRQADHQERQREAREPGRQVEVVAQDVHDLEGDPGPEYVESQHLPEGALPHFIDE